MHRYGLIGRHLGHSFSRDHFTRKFKEEGLAGHRYDLFELPGIESLPALIAGTPGLHGLNVTIPYKEAVIAYLTRLDPLAAAVGAVNNIRIQAGELVGYNTDVHGFRRLLDPVLGGLQDAGSDIRPRALVLGSGGASRAVAFALREAGLRFRVVSRDRTRGDLTWDMLDPTVVGVCRMIINTTPLGMHPDVQGLPPLPYEAIGRGHVLIDLVYNPERTAFLRMGADRGARTVGGLGMLIGQAEEAWRIWQER